MPMPQIKILLDETELPTQWYNVVADMPRPPAPPLAQDGKPISLQALSVIFPAPIIEQEISRARWIPIPEPVREIYRLWRPTPLYRAVRLEQALGTPARLYYKYEGVSPAGSHKPNTAVAQAYFNQLDGTRRLTTETGAGQWGSALAMAGQMFGLEVRVYMVRVIWDQKPSRRSMMETWGAEVIPSPSSETNCGRRVLDSDPDSPGSLGIAISEAVEEAVARDDTHYALGSVLNHVLLHQTVIGLEARKQFEKINEYPDIIVACCGGGSNFGGTAFPFFADKAAGRQVRLLAVEPESCPTLTRGRYAYDSGDSAGLTPLMLMYTLGRNFVPQRATFEAGLIFARAEGIIPAPETNHAIRAAIDEAEACKRSGERKAIFFNLSGHGHFDMAAYDRYLSGQLEDSPYPDDAIKAALTDLPKVAYNPE